MWISRRADAGLRAALGLVPDQAEPRAGEAPGGVRGGPVSARTLAARTGLAAPFVAQVLGRLRRGGVVASVPGRRGGYHLARPADRITVGEVLRVTGATLAPIACAEPGGGVGCDQRDRCRLLPVWARVAAATAGVVDGVTLQDLARS